MSTTVDYLNTYSVEILKTKILQQFIYLFTIINEKDIQWETNIVKQIRQVRRYFIDG